MGMLQKGAGFDTGIGAGVDNDLALEEWEKQKEALEALQTAADDAAQSMYDALVSFADGSATAQEALGGLAGAFAKAFAEAKGFGELGQPISDAISGLIDGTKTASEALKELAASFALAAAKALLLGQGPFANMLVGGAGGGAFNTITNALFGAGGRAATAAPAAFGGALSGTGGLFHTGGIITAHSGASPGVGSLGGLFGISGGGGGGGGKRNSDERLIIAQTGEKIQSRNDVAWGKSSQGQMFQYYFNPIINASGVPHAGMFQQLVDMMRSLLQSEMPTAVRRARQNREI
jgi:hypothetical protein